MSVKSPSLGHPEENKRAELSGLCEQRCGITSENEVWCIVQACLPRTFQSAGFPREASLELDLHLGHPDRLRELQTHPLGLSLSKPWHPWLRGCYSRLMKEWGQAEVCQYLVWVPACLLIAVKHELLPKLLHISVENRAHPGITHSHVTFKRPRSTNNKQAFIYENNLWCCTQGCLIHVLLPALCLIADQWRSHAGLCRNALRGTRCALRQWWRQTCVLLFFVCPLDGNRVLSHVCTHTSP